MPFVIYTLDMANFANNKEDVAKLINFLSQSKARLALVWDTQQSVDIGKHFLEENRWSTTDETQFS